jgi:deoxyribonuclease-2
MTNYINYNDEHIDKVSTSNGHCKGCIAWNDDEAVWLIHSVPKFMLHFHEDGQLDTTKTRIAPSEQVYGQCCILLSGIAIIDLSQLLDQISVMHPFIDKQYSTIPLLNDHKQAHLHSVACVPLSTTIDHLAKPSSFEIDIFSDYLQPVYGGTWRCETWRRGHHCSANPHVIDNVKIHFGDVAYTSSQDHSKYAVNDTGCVYIGDLNRMTSQYHRGGGGIVIKNTGLASAIRSLMNSE